MVSGRKNIYFESVFFELNVDLVPAENLSLRAWIPAKTLVIN